MFSFMVLFVIEVIYWGGVFTGSVAKQTWTNSNPDTWIHGGLAGASLWAIITDIVIFIRKVRKHETQTP